MIYTKNLSFHNVFTQMDDQISLTWDFPNGFTDLLTAKNTLTNYGQDPDIFLYIKHHNQIYAVACDALEQSLVVAEHVVWYRDYPSQKIERCILDNLACFPYTISSCRQADYYKRGLCLEMASFDPDMKIISGTKIREADLSYKDFCVATLAAAAFQTMIPIYQINCIDIYLKDISSFLQLWKIGVKSCNPFLQKEEISSYTLFSYLLEKNAAPEEANQLTLIRDYLLNHGVTDENAATEMLELPVHMAKDLLCLLNGVLTSLGTENAFAVRNVEFKNSLKHIAKEDNDTLSQSDKAYKLCRVCHLSLPSNAVDNICPSCMEQELFSSVKDFIRKYDVNENDVSEHFNIPVNKVREWIKTGRISYKEMRGIHTQELDRKQTRICRECGMLLPSSCQDNICNNCAHIAKATKMRSKKYLSKQPASTKDSTMHYLQSLNHQ